MGTSTEYYGKDRLSWVQETSYGSGGDMGADGEIVGYDARITNLRLNKELSEIISAGNTNREVAGMFEGRNYARFTLEFIPYNWKWLKYLLDVADSGGPTTYTHTFSLADTINTFKLERVKPKATSDVFTFTGGVVMSATINFQKGTAEGTAGAIRVSLDCFSKMPTNNTSVTTLSAGNPSPSSTPPFTFRHVELQLNSTEITEVNSGSIEIDNGINIDESFYANTTLDGAPNDPILGTFRVRSNMNVTEKNTDIYDLWTPGTAVSGTNYLLFDRAGDGTDELKITFDTLYMRSPGPQGNTELENPPPKTDIALQALSITAVAKDGEATY